MKIDFVDLYAQYLTIKKEVDQAIEDVITQSAFIRGPYVSAFESEFAEKTGVSRCISCANGTDALYIALHALGVHSEAEVIVPSHSWISTSETVTQAGGRVVFCDVDEKTYTIDVDLIESKITSKTVGIIPVHLFGQAADMEQINAIAKKHNLWVIEDCAQAHLAEYKGQKVGTFGDVATFSFYPGKNLGAMGDAGAIVTNDNLLVEKMTMFARHGGLSKGDHRIEGINSRMDGLQAAILSVKLKHLREWTDSRGRLASIYSELLSGVTGIQIPRVSGDRTHVWHLYVIQSDKRDQLAGYLKQRGISTVINYPTALPFLPAYDYLGHEAQDFPVAYKAQSKILSLPLYAEMTDEMIGYVCQCIKEFMDAG